PLTLPLPTPAYTLSLHDALPISDPVAVNLVASLARPGSNITGLSAQIRDLAGKRVELLREVIPGLRRSAILVNVGNPSAVKEMGDRKSTRLNSSHGSISYAVFCL